MQEIEILDWINDTFGCSAADCLAIAFEHLFKYDIVWIAVAVLAVLSKNHRDYGRVLLISLAVEICTVYTMKTLIGRPRPYEDYTINLLVDRLSSSSFPSGHTASAFCTAAVTAIFYRKSAIPMFLLAFLVGFTRMYLYVHYPTDVIGGAVIGVLCALFVIFATMRGEPRTIYLKAPEKKDYD